MIPYLALLMLLLLPAFDQYDRGRQTDGRTDGWSQAAIDSANTLKPLSSNPVGSKLRTGDAGIIATPTPAQLVRDSHDSSCTAGQGRVLLAPQPRRPSTCGVPAHTTTVQQRNGVPFLAASRL